MGITANGVRIDGQSSHWQIGDIKMIEKLKDLVDLADNLSACKHNEGLGDKFSLERDEIEGEINEFLDFASRKIKKAVKLLEMSEREDLVIAHVLHRNCTCAKCDDGRQVCAYKISYVCSPNKLDLPDSVYSDTGGLTWLKNKVLVDIENFGYGETMIEAQFDYIKKFEGKNASKFN